MKELQDVIAAFEQVESCSKAAALATLVKIQGSSYRRPGARMLMTPAGRMAGSISGGCLEEDVFEHAQQVMQTGNPIVVKYDTAADEEMIWGLGLGCNGMLHILIESLTQESQLSQIKFIAECLQRRQIGVLATVFWSEGEVRAKVGDRLMLHQDANAIANIADFELTTAMLKDAQAAFSQLQSKVKLYSLSAGKAEVFIEVIQPPVPLVLFGAGDDAIPVVRLAKELGWHVTVVDNRSNYANSAQFGLADVVILARPEAVCKHLLDSRTVAVVMTHNYRHDLELLKILLPSPLQYLGILGPKRRTEKLLQELQETGMTPTKEQLERLYSPVGLDIGADTPEEIALAVLAEIKAVIAKRSGSFLRNCSGPIHHAIA